MLIVCALRQTLVVHVPLLFVIWANIHLMQTISAEGHSSAGCLHSHSPEFSLASLAQPFPAANPSFRFASNHLTAILYPKCVTCYVCYSDFFFCMKLSLYYALLLISSLLIWQWWFQQEPVIAKNFCVLEWNNWE